MIHVRINESQGYSVIFATTKDNLTITLRTWRPSLGGTKIVRLKTYSLMYHYNVKVVRIHKTMLR
uniref:Uncharacterized protein n=1 Tax=Arundo donax TaxID=35708 RepID=A0A0A8YW31_ARUDO